jgi:hypothetical protein
MAVPQLQRHIPPATPARLEIVETRELGAPVLLAGKPRSVASSVLAAIALVNWHVIWLAGGPELDSDEA